MNYKEQILADIRKEVHNATVKFPLWPDSMHVALAVVNEEVGELAKDVVQLHDEPEKAASLETIRVEAIQSAAMLVRFIISIDEGNYRIGPSIQHEQHQ